MKNIGYYNGHTDLIESLQIPMTDRAVYFGDGVYDVAMIINGVMFAIDEHIERFFKSCRLLEIDFKLTSGEIKAIFTDMMRQVDDLSEAILYWQASRGSDYRNHQYPDASVPATLLAYIKPKKLPDITKEIKLITLDDLRYELCNIKTINLIPNVMASQKAALAGCDESVLIRNGLVTECSHSNASMIKDGVFRTHPLDNHVLPGIARGHVLSICRELGIPVDETAFTPAEMMEADEVVVTSTTTLIRRACEIDGKPVGGKASALFQRIQAAYVNKVRRETGEK